MRRTLTVITAGIVGAATLATLATLGPTIRRSNTQPARLTPVVADAYPATGARIRIWDSPDHGIIARPGQTVWVTQVTAVSVLTRAPDTANAWAACAVYVGGELVETNDTRIPGVYAACTWHTASQERQ